MPPVPGTIPSPQAVTSSQPNTYRAALWVVTTLFFMWGFLTCLNDILVPHLKSIFDLTYFQVMLIQFAFFSAYFIFSIPSAKIIDWIGYKKTMVLGLLTMGLGAFLFIPAASLPSYPLFLGALMVLAAGITALQVAANPYVAVLGPPQTASSRLNLAQAFNSLGTTIAPYLGGVLILAAVPQSMDVVRQMSASALQAYRVQTASSVKLPYLVIGFALIVLGFLISLFKLPAIPGAVHHKGERVAGKGLWSHRHLVLGMVAIFVYVGAEVSIGSFLINYFNQKEIGNLSAVVAAGYVAFYWGGAMIGRFIGSALLHGVKTVHMAVCSAIAGALVILSYMLSGPVVAGTSPQIASLLSSVFGVLVHGRPLVALCFIALTLLTLMSVFNNGRASMTTGHLLGLAGLSTATLVTVSMLTSGHLAMWSIILVGFFNSIMFPSIFTLGIAELGPLTGDGSGMLVMAIVGGAIIPVVQGAIADRIGIHHAFILPVICYLYIVFYAFVGSKPKPALAS
jgi:FHS family L-fucose permease-like MFS transporter